MILVLSYPTSSTPVAVLSDITVKDLIKLAFMEIGVLSAVDDLDPEDLELGRLKFNLLLDAWTADESASYAGVRLPFTLTPNLSPHTIGPSGTWVVASRPVSLDFVSLNLGSGVWMDVLVRSKAWYDALAVPDLTSTIPTDVYYNPGWPNGSLYFWPVPTVAYPILITTRTVFPAVQSTDTFSSPPGYQNAAMLTLAESLVNPSQVPMPPNLERSARMARARIFSNNVDVPKLATRNSGIPGGRSSFNYRTGQ